MDIERTALRDALARIERRGRGRPYPEALRARAVAYLNRRQRAGVPLHVIGGELGISWRTLVRWRSTTPSEFRAVEIEVAVSASTRLIVHGPRGLRVEGLDLGALVELWRSLS